MCTATSQSGHHPQTIPTIAPTVSIVQSTGDSRRSNQSKAIDYLPAPQLIKSTEEKPVISPKSTTNQGIVTRKVERTIPILTETTIEDCNVRSEPEPQSIPISRELSDQLVIKNSRLEEMGPHKMRTSPTYIWDQHGPRGSSDSDSKATNVDKNEKKVSIKIPIKSERKSGVESEFDSGRRSLEDMSRGASLENLVYSDSSSQEPDSVHDSAADLSHEPDLSAPEQDSAHGSHSSVEVVDEPDTESTIANYPTCLSTSVSLRSSSTIYNIPSHAPSQSYTTAG